MLRQSGNDEDREPIAASGHPAAGTDDGAVDGSEGRTGCTDGMISSQRLVSAMVDADPLVGDRLQ